MQEEQKTRKLMSKFKIVRGNSGEKEEKCVYIPVDNVMPNPYQPRRKFDITALSELADSISQVGVISPISVRIAPGGYELVCGERRLRAAKMAGLKKIPALIVEITDKESAIVAITENLQRKDLTFFEEAESMQNLIEFHSMTQDAVAKQLGKSQAAVANKIRLLKLPESVRRAVTEGGMCERHARALLRLPNEELQLAAATRINDLQMNVSSSEKMIQKMLEDEPKKKLLNKENTTFEKTGMLFKNTLNKTFEMLKKSGISPLISEKEAEDFIEYTIKLEK
ncbi:MAG: ParB/RepB/Spo0J family partition protein [Clostridia bacterium]|nr:ParB/RepB/Spo0J family partition protein [Clostridia bacterium]